MKRRSRTDVVESTNHAMCGMFVRGNFGIGVVLKVRWCAMWKDRQVGIRYYWGCAGCVERKGDELMYEDLGKVEVVWTGSGKLRQRAEAE